MAEPREIEVDLAPGHLLDWLEVEMHGADTPPLTVRATRDWRLEPAGRGEGLGLDPEDELASHVALGTVEVVPRDGCWRLRLEVVDAINGGTAEDWPPVGIESDGPDEVSLATFADTFPVDEIESRVTLEAETSEARRKAERMITRILEDTHRRRADGGPRPAGRA
jgi:hypothetical protein